MSGDGGAGRYCRIYQYRRKPVHSPAAGSTLPDPLIKDGRMNVLLVGSGGREHALA